MRFWRLLKDNIQYDSNTYSQNHTGSDHNSIQGQVRKFSIFGKSKNDSFLAHWNLIIVKKQMWAIFEGEMRPGTICDQNYGEENRMSEFRNLKKIWKTILNLNWLLGELIQLRI